MLRQASKFGWAALALATPAVAQTMTKGAPEQNSWVSLTILGVLIVCVFVASLMSSRRGHQD